MNRRYRKTIIAGNWKMNMTPSQAKALIEELKPMVSKVKWCEMVLCVPYVDIPTAVKAAKGSKIAIGAENMHFEPKGAYTGEVSADMLKECGVKYVIIGHSERRQYFAETDETVNTKVKVAMEPGFRPSASRTFGLKSFASRLSALFRAYLLMTSRRLSSLTSRSGLLALARLLLLTRLTRFALQSVTA